MTLAFTAVLAVLLTATGLFLYLRLSDELDATINRGLRSRAGDVTALIKQADSGLAQAGRSPLTERGESVAQVVGLDGGVLDAPPALRHRRLLTAGELQRARAGTIVVSHPRTPIDDAPVRLLATPVRAQGRRMIVVVGAAVDPRDAALSNLSNLMLIGGPIALLLAGAAGFGAAASALRPVESMRRRAREIQAGAPGRRLPVPPSGDELARLGATLNEMLERLEEAFERERAFVADASHELRTPLAIVKAELELALRDAVTVDEFRTAVASAAEETDRVVALAEDLLVIARSDQGRLLVQTEAIAVAEFFDGIGRRFGRRATERGVALILSAPPELEIMADRARLEQAVGNLVDNALRHAGTTVTVSATAAGDGVEIQVCDDGAGFPEAFIAHAFKRFSRADTARGRGGAGLGLAIVAAVAEAHGGSVQAANRPALGGADVCLSLPRTPGAPAVA